MRSECTYNEVVLYPENLRKIPNVTRLWHHHTCEGRRQSGSFYNLHDISGEYSHRGYSSHSFTCTKITTWSFSAKLSVATDQNVSNKSY